MFSHKILKCQKAVTRDETANQLFNLGKKLKITKPYIIKTRNGVSTVFVDSDLLSKYIYYTNNQIADYLTDDEMFLFSIKTKIESGSKISEEEKTLVVTELAANLVLFNQGSSTRDVPITTKWKNDSSENMEARGEC